MSGTNADRYKKLEEMKKRKEELEARKILAAKNQGGLGSAVINPSSRNLPDDGSKGASQHPAAKSGPVIQVSERVGFLSIRPKEKAYMFDKSVEVTKEQIDLLKELQEEEKMPVYNLKEEEKDKNLEDEEGESKKKEKLVKVLPEEEVGKIFKKNHFIRFIRKSSETFDSELSEDEGSLYEDMISRNDVGVQGEKDMMSLLFSLRDESVKDYIPTNLQFSRTNADLLLVVYSTNDLSKKHKSKILIWSMKNKLKPLYVMHSEMKVTRACFKTTNESLVFAATYSGNILQFSVAPETGPQFKNFNLAEKDEYHATPIFSFECFSFKGVDYLVSVSVDGRTCVWDTNYLLQPVFNKIFDLPKKDSKIKFDLLHVLNSTLHKANSEEGQICMVTQDANIVIHNLSSFFKADDEEEKPPIFIQTDHKAPICTASTKEDPLRPFLDNLILTGSFDFDVQLWNFSDVDSTLLRKFSFHNDYVIAVDWNPVHPAMFASCDCSGRFLVFDLLTNPSFYAFEGDADSTLSMKWSPCGMKLTFINTKGEVQVWQMRKKYLKFDEEKLQLLKRELY